MRYQAPFQPRFCPRGTVCPRPCAGAWRHATTTATNVSHTPPDSLSCGRSLAPTSQQPPRSYLALILDCAAHQGRCSAGRGVRLSGGTVTTLRAASSHAVQRPTSTRLTSMTRGPHSQADPLHAHQPTQMPSQSAAPEQPASSLPPTLPGTHAPCSNSDLLPSLSDEPLVLGLPPPPFYGQPRSIASHTASRTRRLPRVHRSRSRQRDRVKLSASANLSYVRGGFLLCLSASFCCLFGLVALTQACSGRGSACGWTRSCDGKPSRHPHQRPDIARRRQTCSRDRAAVVGEGWRRITTSRALRIAR